MLISRAWQGVPAAAGLLVELADAAVARAGSLVVRGVGVCPVVALCGRVIAGRDGRCGPGRRG